MVLICVNTVMNRNAYVLEYKYLRVSCDFHVRKR